jgi:hypothetical protein
MLQVGATGTDRLLFNDKPEDGGSSSETSVANYHITRSHNPYDNSMNPRHNINMKSCTVKDKSPQKDQLYKLG